MDSGQVEASWLYQLYKQEMAYVTNVDDTFDSLFFFMMKTHFLIPTAMLTLQGASVEAFVRAMAEYAKVNTDKSGFFSDILKRKVVEL